METPIGFGFSGFDSLDINGERVVGNLAADGRDPNVFRGMVDFDSNPAFDSSNVSGLGITFALQSDSDAFVTLIPCCLLGRPAYPNSE